MCSTGPLPKEAPPIVLIVESFPTPKVVAEAESPLTVA